MTKITIVTCDWIDNHLIAGYNLINIEYLNIYIGKSGSGTACDGRNVTL